MAHEPLPHAHMHLEAPDMPRWNPRSRHRDPWGCYIEANLTVSAGGVTVLRILCTVVTVSFYSSREGRPLYRVPTRDSTTYRTTRVLIRTRLLSNSLSARRTCPFVHTR